MSDVQPADAERRPFSAPGGRLDLLLLCLAALTLRLTAHYALPNIIWPDEVFQLPEPAYRALFGSGIVTWEWVVGARSWLFPGIVLGLMAVGHLFGSDPAILQFPVVLFMALASCLPVACTYGWGRRLGGREGGLVAAAVTVVWPDLIYFSTHTLNDVIAGDLLIWALYLGFPGVPVRRGARFFYFGLLLGLVFDFRYVIAPVLGLAGLWACVGSGWTRRLGIALAGALIPVLGLGLIDWLTLGAPYQSIYRQIWLELTYHVSQQPGTSPMAMYFTAALVLWGGAIPMIGFCALLGARRLKPLFGIATALVVLFTLLQHREPRYIFPAIPLAATLVGVGTAELVGWIAALGRPALSDRGQLARLAILFWTVTSLALLSGPIYQERFAHRREMVESFAAVSGLPGLCGVALYGVNWIETLGNSGLPPGVGLYVTTPQTFAHDADGFDAVLADAQSLLDDDRYTRLGCYENDAELAIGRVPAVCVWHRAGSCRAGVARSPRAAWPEGVRPDDY